MPEMTYVCEAVDRFRLVKRAMHGTRMMTMKEIRELYGRETVKLRNESRWVFLNTLFSVSEAVMFSQLVDRLDQVVLKGVYVYEAVVFSQRVDRLDQGIIPQSSSGMTYQGLYKLVAKALYRTHVEGKLKAEIIQEPEKFVELDNAMVQTLKDQRDSGKQVLLITNSDYEYTDRMMSYAHNRYMPEGSTWRDLFDMVKGEDFLYIGDHIYTDAALAKLNFRWRTALILRELEEEVAALADGTPHREKLKELMEKKEMTFEDVDSLNETLAQLLMVLEVLDEQIGSMLEQDGSMFNERWGYLSRAGLNDKSSLIQQVEKYADIYTSRVSNFQRYTPFMYFRSPSQSLAHDRNLTKYYKRKYTQGPANPAAKETNGQ
eukprot:gene19954-26662_t